MLCQLMFENIIPHNVVKYVGTCAYLLKLPIQMYYTI